MGTMSEVATNNANQAELVQLNGQAFGDRASVIDPNTSLDVAQFLAPENLDKLMAAGGIFQVNDEYSKMIFITSREGGGHVVSVLQGTAGDSSLTPGKRKHEVSVRFYNIEDGKLLSVSDTASHIKQGVQTRFDPSSSEKEHLKSELTRLALAIKGLQEPVFQLTHARSDIEWGEYMRDDR